MPGRSNGMNKDTEAKRDLALRKGALPLERGTQALIWNLDSVDIHAGKLDHHIGQVLIVIAQKLIEGKAESLFDSVDTFLGVHDLVRQLDPLSTDFWGPELRFTDRDFNRILNKRLTSAEIETLVGKLPTLIFRVHHRASLKVVDQETGKTTWKEYEITNYDNIAGVEVIKSGEMKRGLGAGEERRAYRIYFKSRIGLAFWHNMAAGGYSLLTNEQDRRRRFLALPGSAQMLVWALWGWADNKPAIRSREQLFRIMGWKRAKETSNYLAQVKRLAEYLDRLVRDGFLQSWSIKENGAYQMEKFTSANALKSRGADSPTTANLLSD
jgi:hypothetical protein